MTRWGLSALAGLAALLAAGLGVELGPGFKDESGMRQPQPPQASPSQAVLPPRGNGSHQAAVDTILARPLFAPNRRPPAAAAAAAGGPPAALPRVSGIMVDGMQRRVFFAAPEGGQPMVAAEGTVVRGYRVQSINAAEVTVIGPNGPLVLRPAFDPAPAPARPTLGPAPPGLPGLPGLTLPNLGAIPGLSAR